MSMTSRRNFLTGTVAAATAAMIGGGTIPSALAAAAEPAKAAGGAEPKFKLGMVTYNVGAKLELPELLRVCKSAGIAAVELRTTHKHGVEPTISKDARKEVKKQFADAGVVIWGTGSTCEFHSPDPAVVQKNIETCKQFVELTADIGGRGVKVRPNGLPKTGPIDKTLEQIGKALVPCGKAGADAGVEIWVEVHGGGTSVPANVKTFMQHCGHPNVGLTWNSNATDVKDGSVAEAFGMLKQWIRSCHINDLTNDANGKYPYRELFRLFRETGYDRYTLCEVGTTMPDEKSAEAFMKQYKASWESLARG